MKKALVVVLVLCAVGVVAFFALRKSVFHQPQAAELVPAETVLFMQIPDLGGSAGRLKETALWKIYHDPEMQAFLEKPRQQSAATVAQADGVMKRIERIQPREVFAAVTSIEKTIPTMVAGFAFTGKQAEAETLVSEWRASLREKWPAGKADLTTYGKHEVQTFTAGEMVIAESFRSGWYFIANDLALLQQTLDRADGKGDAKAQLTASATYKSVRGHLPKEPEALVVAQLEPVMERITSLLVAAGSFGPDRVEEMRKSKGFAASTQFDGERSRDTFFMLQSGGTNQPALAQHALALSSADSLFYQSSAMPPKVEIPAQTALVLGMIPGFGTFQQALTAQGLALEDLPKAFGPESGFLMDWAQGAPTPGLLVALDVRDREKATAFLNVLGNGAIGGVPWERKEQDGVVRMSPPMVEGLGFFSPAIALTEKFVLLALNADGLEKAIASAKNSAARLDGIEAYKTAAKSVVKPTAAFGYLDLRTLFERTYGVFKPLLAMSLAFSPDAGKYIDAGKLPPAEAISRHLSPLVYSQAITEEGVLMESTGPITLTQLMVGTLAGVAPTALPAMEAALSGGALLDPTQMFKGLMTPPASPAADPVQVAPPVIVPTAPDAAPTPPLETPDAAPAPTLDPAPSEAH